MKRAEPTRGGRSEKRRAAGGGRRAAAGENAQRSTLNAERSTGVTAPAPARGEVLPVPLAEIGPSPFQTRAAETAEELAGLAASIAAQTREEGSDGDD